MSKRAIFDKKNVLVSGGAGFIGSHLCDELVKTCKVICLDDFSTGDEKNIDHLLVDPNFEFIRHDISQPIDLEKMPELQKFKIEFQGLQEIYNLACPTSPVDFEKNIINTMLTQSYGLKNMLDLAIKYQAKFLHFSSSVVYGSRQAGKKIKETDLGLVDMLSARSSYDEGKRFAETMAVNYARVYKIDVKIIRLFRIYGPRMKLDHGHLIPDFISQALDDKDIIIPGDKNFSSSFCYVSDAVDAAIKIMQTDIGAQPVNIGSDIDVNLSELVKKIITIISAKSKINYGDEHMFITQLCLPDISRARNLLGWLPVVTLEKGLAKTIDDLRASKGLKGIE